MLDDYYTCKEGKYINICDWVWENLSYLHTNFDLIFRTWSLITFSLNMMLILFSTYALITGGSADSAETYKIDIVYP